MLTAPFSASPPATRSMPVAVARSSVPLKVAAVKVLLLELAARNDPPPAALITPLRPTPFCRMVLPAPTSIWLPTVPVTFASRTSVPPFLASRTPLLVTPLLGVRLNLPPDTSAEMRPLLISDWVPPLR